MSTLKLIQIGDSIGVILPNEVLARLKVESCDVLYLTEVANGVTLTPYDPAVEAQVEAGREFMREYKNTFHPLAK